MRVLILLLVLCTGCIQTYCEPEYRRLRLVKRGVKTHDLVIGGYREEASTLATESGKTRYLIPTEYLPDEASTGDWVCACESDGDPPIIIKRAK